jgi:hypothetical protein
MVRMETSQPAIEFNSRFEGKGALRRGNLQVPVTSAILERDKYEHTEPWPLTTNSEDSSAESLRSITADSSLPLSFLGTTDQGHTIHVPHVRWFRTQGTKLRANVYEFDIDPEPHSRQPAKQRLTVYVPPNSIAREELLLVPNANGTIEGHTKMFDPHTWALDIGTGTLSLRFGFEPASVGRSEAMVRIPQPLARRECSTLSTHP